MVQLKKHHHDCGWSCAHGVRALRHLHGRGPSAPRPLVGGGGGGLHWHRHGFSTRQTGHTLLRPPPPPHRFLRLPPPTNFCKWNSSSSVVVGVSGAVQQENCLQEGGKHVACGLRQKVCSATLAGGGRTSSTKQE
jgi:hypothetical protein